MNETRTGLLNAFQEMGAEIDIINKTENFEPRADLKVKFSKLKGINLDKKLVPNLIDELPALCRRGNVIRFNCCERCRRITQ